MLTLLMWHGQQQQENRPPPGIDVADSAVFLRSPTSHRALKKTSSDARLRDMR